MMFNVLMMFLNEEQQILKAPTGESDPPSSSSSSQIRQTAASGWSLLFSARLFSPPKVNMAAGADGRALLGEDKASGSSWRPAGTYRSSRSGRGPSAPGGGR